jgi:1,2-diacylglycerol 3-alpha-glucosyltransferase
MRILIGIEAYYPLKAGSAYAAYRLATGLVKRGHEVFVVTPGEGFKAHKTAEDKITVYRVGSFPLSSGLRIAPFARYYVAPIVEEIKPNVIHVEDHFFVAWSLIDYARKHKIPLVGTNHYHPRNLTHYLNLPSNLEKKLEKLAWKHFNAIYGQLDIITTPTETSKQIMTANGFKKPIRVISNGIDMAYFKPFPKEELGDLAKKYNLNGGFKKVLFVGRLEKEKSIDVTIRAVQLASKEIDVKFFVIGVGSEREELEKLAVELGIVDKVTFLGGLPDEDVRRIYSLCDLFITSSTVELQGLVVMEAMASSLPIVSSQGMALHELVQEGQNGYIFPNGDYKTAAEKILLVLRDSPKAENMGKASLELIKKHDVELSLDKYEYAYEDAILQKVRVPLKKLAMAVQKIALNSLTIILALLILAGMASTTEIYRNRSELYEAYVAAKTKTTYFTQEIKNISWREQLYRLKP